MTLPLAGIRVIDFTGVQAGAATVSAAARGEHTDEVLAKLGYSAEQIAKMRAGQDIQRLELFGFHSKQC